MSETLPYDHIKFEVFCVESYRAAKGMSGR